MKKEINRIAILTNNIKYWNRTTEHRLKCVLEYLENAKKISRKDLKETIQNGLEDLIYNFKNMEEIEDTILYMERLEGEN